MKDKRICEVCGCEMTEGYLVDEGAEYYCSDACLYTRYTEDEVEAAVCGENSSGEICWTAWYDSVVEGGESRV